MFEFSKSQDKITIKSNKIFIFIGIGAVFMAIVGISYCCQTRYEGNTYYLYFSEHKCQAKNECRKRLRGKMIKTFIIGKDYFEVVEKIIPFCSDKTDIRPFVGEDKYHFI